MATRREIQERTVTRRSTLGPPVADFGISPAAPTTSDDIRLYDFSFDPDGRGIASHRWDFGDGDTSRKRSPRHRFDSPGGYDVRLEVTTPDGRTCSIVRQLQVRPDSSPSFGGQLRR
jgi:PKD repeat protein